jgi:8-oxo-dGTP diphosphatase
VGVLVEKDGKVLMLRRKHVHGSGTWSTPGGHLEFGEEPVLCGIREVEEETGIQVKKPKFLAVTNDVFPEHGKHSITLWYRAEYESGTARIGDASEMDQVGWYPKEALPEPLFLPLRNLLETEDLPWVKEPRS